MIFNRIQCFKNVFECVSMGLKSGQRAIHQIEWAPTTMEPAKTQHSKSAKSHTCVHVYPTAVHTYINRRVHKLSASRTHTHTYHYPFMNERNRYKSLLRIFIISIWFNNKNTYTNISQQCNKASSYVLCGHRRQFCSCRKHISEKYTRSHSYWRQFLLFFCYFLIFSALF